MKLELIPVLIKGMQEQELITRQNETIEQMQRKMDELTKLVIGAKQAITSSALLSQNAPNPFNTDTNIQYSVPSTGRSAQLIISTQDGKQLQSYTVKKGNSQLTIHGSTLPAGQYLYSLIIDGRGADTTMVLTR